MSSGMPVTAELLAKINQLLLDNCTRAEITEKTGRTPSTIDKILDRERRRRLDTAPCSICGKRGTTGELGHPTQHDMGPPLCVKCGGQWALARNGRGV